MTAMSETLDRPAEARHERTGDVALTAWQASSLKVTEIEKLPKVNVSFADPDNQRYVSVSGSAQLVRDRAKIAELWKPEFKISFTEGKDDPEIALLRVSLEKAEYWDSPSSTIGYALSFVSSLVTGKEPDFGENKRVEFS